jgi:hypothetical protein
VITDLDLDALDDAALARLTAATDAAANAKSTLVRLQAEQQRRKAKAESRAAEAAVLLEKLTTLLAKFEADYRDAVAGLQATPPDAAWPVVEKVYTLGRQAYSLAHDLRGATGDRKFHRYYTVIETLNQHPTGRAFVRAHVGKPPKIAIPWHADLQRLVSLLGPVPNRIGNGG